jgi:hypothetical protein
MERAFDVLADNLRDIGHRGAPSRATELSLGNGGIALGDETNITISARYASNGTEATNVSETIRPIEYRNGETRIRYTSGAVIRSDRGDAIIRSEPDWLVSSRTTVIPLFVTSGGDGATSLAGDTTILVVAERRNQDLGIEFAPRTTRVNVSVTVESADAEAWGRFLEAEGFTAADGDASDGDITYWLVTDELSVPRTYAGIRFSR